MCFSSALTSLVLLLSCHVFFSFLFVLWCESSLVCYSHVTFWFLPNFFKKFFRLFPTCLTSYDTIFLELFLCSIGVLNGNEKKWSTVILLTAFSLCGWLKPKKPTSKGWEWAPFPIVTNSLMHLNATKPKPAPPHLPHAQFKIKQLFGCRWMQAVVRNPLNIQTDTG